MNWFYILLRTFPFWGIPTGLVMVFSGGRNKKKFFVLGGIALLVAGVAFLFLQGQFKAVPWAHDLMYGPR